MVDVVDFTSEGTTDDLVGHSTFMAGTISSHAASCSGFAPGGDHDRASIRLFTGSSTAWFLDGFNYALRRRFDIINLAVGGPDYRDRPFADKVRQLAATGVTIVSGAGNSGPGWARSSTPPTRRGWSVSAGSIWTGARAVVIARHHPLGAPPWHRPSSG